MRSRLTDDENDNRDRDSDREEGDEELPVTTSFPGAFPPAIDVADAPVPIATQPPRFPQLAPSTSPPTAITSPIQIRSPPPPPLHLHIPSPSPTTPPPSTPPPLGARTPLPPTAPPPDSPTLHSVSLPAGTPIAIPVSPFPMTPMQPVVPPLRKAVPSRLLEGVFSPNFLSSSGGGSAAFGGGIPSPSWMTSPAVSPPEGKRLGELRVGEPSGSGSTSSPARIGLGLLNDEAEEEEERWGPIEGSPTRKMLALGLGAMNRSRPTLSPVQPSLSSLPGMGGHQKKRSPLSLSAGGDDEDEDEDENTGTTLLPPAEVRSKSGGSDPLSLSSSPSFSSGGDGSGSGERSGSGSQVGRQSRTVTPGESPRSSLEDVASTVVAEPTQDAPPRKSSTPSKQPLLPSVPTKPALQHPVIVGEARLMDTPGAAFPPSIAFTSVPIVMPKPPTSSPATSSSDNTTASGGSTLVSLSSGTPPSVISSETLITPPERQGEEDGSIVSVPGESLNPYFSSVIVPSDDDLGEDDEAGEVRRRPALSRKTTQSSANDSSTGSSTETTSSGTATGADREAEREHTPDDRGQSPSQAAGAPRTRSEEQEVESRSGQITNPRDSALTPDLSVEDGIEQARHSIAEAEAQRSEPTGISHAVPSLVPDPSTSRPIANADPSEMRPPMIADIDHPSSPPASFAFSPPLESDEPLTRSLFQRRRSGATASLHLPEYAPPPSSSAVRAADSPYPSPPNHGPSTVAWDPTAPGGGSLFGAPSRADAPARPAATVSSGGAMFQPMPSAGFMFPPRPTTSSGLTSSSAAPAAGPVGESSPPLDAPGQPNAGPNSSSDGQSSWLHHEGETPDDGVVGDASEDAAVGRVASMSLIAAVTAAGVVNEATRRVFAEEVARVGRDHVYWVRREAAYAMGALAKVVGQDVLVDAMLPLYEDMTKDSFWHVRQSALFALPGILARLPQDRRRQLALSQCRLLSHDTAKSVRAALLEVMGEVIYSFRNDEEGPPSELVDLFIGKNEQHEDATWTEPPEEVTRMWGLAAPFKNESVILSPTGTSPPLRSLFESTVDPASFGPRHFRSASSPPSTAKGPPTIKRDPDRVLKCAFNFPAVVASMGSRRWSELQTSYLGLTQHNVMKVRRTLAASIGEIARIIGEVQTHRDLISVWWEFVHDDAADVREKIVNSIEMYIAALPVEDKRNVAVQLEALWDTSLSGWKEREALAAQLGNLAALLSPVGRAGSVKTIMIKALTDAVSAVREAAVSSYSKYVQYIPEDIALIAKSDLFTLASSASFRRRVTFVAVCQSMVLGRTLVDTLSNGYMEAFATLSQDPVVDVRIPLSRLISIICEQSFLDPSTRPPAITSIISTLSHDVSPQVRAFIAFIASNVVVPKASASTSSSPSHLPQFGLFSRPPTRSSSFTETLSDSNTAHMAPQPENTSLGTPNSGSVSSRPSAGVPSTSTVTASVDDNPFLHDY